MNNYNREIEMRQDEGWLQSYVSKGREILTENVRYIQILEAREEITPIDIWRKEHSVPREDPGASAPRQVCAQRVLEKARSKCGSGR